MCKLLVNTIARQYNCSSMRWAQQQQERLSCSAAQQLVSLQLLPSALQLPLQLEPHSTAISRQWRREGSSSSLPRQRKQQSEEAATRGGSSRGGGRQQTGQQQRGPAATEEAATKEAGSNKAGTNKEGRQQQRRQQQRRPAAEKVGCSGRQQQVGSNKGGSS